jgi:WXG100 family type VII secretion target
VNDDLLYSYEGIDNVAGAIAAFVSQMNGNLAEVDAKFKTLINNGWSGAGADAFALQSAKWHQAADQMAMTLQKLSTKVGDASIHMRGIDAKAAARFA